MEPIRYVYSKAPNGRLVHVAKSGYSRYRMTACNIYMFSTTRGGWEETETLPVHRPLCRRCLQEMEVTMPRRETLIRQLEIITNELDRIDSMPEDDFEGEAVVIWFKKRFGGPHSDEYTYAFVRFADGSWAGTGPRAPKYYSWDELMSWVSEGVDEIWFATEWEQI